MVVWTPKGRSACSEPPDARGPDPEHSSSSSMTCMPRSWEEKVERLVLASARYDHDIHAAPKREEIENVAIARASPLTRRQGQPP